MTEPEPLLYSIGETATLLGLTKATIRRLIERGELSKVKMGTHQSARVRVEATDIDRYIERHRVKR